MTAILLDRLYKTDALRKDGNIITARITFDVQHAIFNGHFPDMPIVPGVCQIQILGEILNTVNGPDLQLLSAASIKFLSIVDPTITPSLDLLITCASNDNGSYSVSALYQWEEKVFFKFKGTYFATA